MANAWPQIERCRRHQLDSGTAPLDVVALSRLVGYVNLRYGHSETETPNAGEPYLMKLLSEEASMSMPQETLA